MATHSSILAWKITQTGIWQAAAAPGGLTGLVDFQLPGFSNPVPREKRM